ncbi:serine dehydratase subunit alpha family protein [Parabacteroides sp. Marseille-P3160]|uniref:L-cysteine desulfidase family protein n=1 Tax=Parabacteroides sp. Marseille-P3160 TaxID=1917887 RepID=UPI0009BADA3A|nr:L-serine ammonia-lyase, iron-sulfur-dependent, subunit alpha [Parabacteroides sp. Marseille-P3160]
MEKKLYDEIIALAKKEVIPAIGCTEPIAVSLCVAKAKEILGYKPEKIKVYLSANVLKNAMGVGIPGANGMIGLPIAVALGALIGKSEYLLEVLKDSSPEALEAGKQMIDSGNIEIKLKDKTDEMLYIEAICSYGNQTATAIIAGEHTNFIYLKKDDTVLFDSKLAPKVPSAEDMLGLNMHLIYDFSVNSSIDDIEFILESARINKAASEQSFKNKYGHELGRTLNGKSQYSVMGDSVFTNILSYTSAACDARMAGAMIPVMSNSGSGNQGIAATLPVTIYAEKYNKTKEELARALMLSHLTVIYIKQKLGRLSALCGCVIAATGSSCGIVLLMGGKYEQITFAVKNMIANLTGMICDGAKPGCSMKVASGVSTALLSAMLAMEQKCVTSVEGIIDDDVDKCIDNLTCIGSQAMRETDKAVLDIMTHKK